MTNAEALEQLRKDPIKFLNKHRLRVAAEFETTRDEPVWFFKDDDPFGGDDSFSINNVVSDPPHVGDPVKFDVYGVRMYNFAHVDAKKLPPALLPPRHGGPSFMATATLTGCSMVMQQRHGDGGPFVAHIKPDEDHHQGGKALQKDLEGARFEGSTHSTEVYGRLDYPDELNATVIALRSENDWDLYAQSWGGVGANRKIHRVKKFSLR